MKFLVLGCNGMAGHMISLYLKEQGHIVTGFARKKSKYVNSIVGDATNFEELRSIIQKGNYDSVINCIGILNQYAENNHALAVLLNGYLPHFLSKITENTGVQVIQMSTDCVFSGKTGGYTEDSIPDGIKFYDRTKAIGELNDEKNLTLRTSIVGPDINPKGIGLLNWFMQQKNSANGYTGAIWTGQTTLQLAKTMEYAAMMHSHGLYNVVPEDSINKFELLQLFNVYIRNIPIQVVPTTGLVINKSLVRTRFEGLDYKIPSYELMIKELGEWMRAHRDIYPQYIL